jgi:hypothetical protein
LKAKIGSYSIQICELMPIRIRYLIQLISFDADPDFYLMRMRILVTKMMRILPDPDQQHGSKVINI